MKTRTGFISNSSSSSFIVGLKGPISKENILQCMGVDEHHLFFCIADEIADYIVEEHQKGKSIVYSTFQDLEKEYSEKWAMQYKSLFDKGMFLISMYASYNEAGCPIEWYLGNSSFKAENENIMMKVCSP